MHNCPVYRCVHLHVLVFAFNTVIVCSPNQAKPIYGGWLLLAPEGTHFDNPLHRSRVSGSFAGHFWGRVLSLFLASFWWSFMKTNWYSLKGSALFHPLSVDSAHAKSL